MDSPIHSIFKNPYIAGDPVTEPTMFFGREDVFQWIDQNLEGKYNRNMLVIHGQRRVGKTSVLRQLPRRLKGNYAVVFCDLQGRTGTSLGTFLHGLAQTMATNLLQDYKCRINVPDRERFERESGFFEETFIPRVLGALRNRELLLCFDEFDTLESPKDFQRVGMPFIEILKRLSSNKNIGFICSVGSIRFSNENKSTSYKSFFKVALVKQINFLSQPETFSLITEPVKELFGYTEQAQRYIFEITSGHPYFVQLICQVLFSKFRNSFPDKVDQPAIADVLDEAVVQGKYNLESVWDEATDLEKWILALLAEMPLETRSADNLRKRLRAENVYVSQEEITAALNSLNERDVLNRENRFKILLMELWLRRNRPVEVVHEWVGLKFLGSPSELWTARLKEQAAELLRQRSSRYILAALPVLLLIWLIVRSFLPPATPPSAPTAAPTQPPRPTIAAPLVEPSTPAVNVPPKMPTLNLNPTSPPPAGGTQSLEEINSSNAYRLREYANLGKGPTTGMALSPDDRLLAVAAASGLYVYDAATFQEIWRSETVKNLNALVFSPDGRQIFATADDGQVVAWAADGKPSRSLAEKGGTATSLAISPDGKLLACGNSDGSINIWNTADGRLRSRLVDPTLEARANRQGRAFGVTALDFSPNGQKLAAGMQDGTLYFWEPAEGEQKTMFLSSYGEIHDVKYSPDGKYLAAATENGYIRLFSIERNDFYLWYSTSSGTSKPASAVLRLAFHPTKALLMGGTRDNKIEVLAVPTGQFIAEISPTGRRGGSGFITAIIFSRGTARAYTSASDGMIRLWDSELKAVTRTLPGFAGWVTGLQFTADGAKLAAAANNGYANVWSVPDKKMLFSWVDEVDPDPLDEQASAALSPDGRTLALATGGRALTLWDLETGKIVRRVVAEGLERFRRVIFSKVGQLLTGDGQKLRRWENGGERAGPVLEGSLGVFSDDGQNLAFVDGSTIKIEQQKDLKVRPLPLAVTSDVRKLVFSRNGQRLAVADGASLLLVSILSDGGAPVKMDNNRPIRDVAFSPDDQLLAAAVEGQAVKIWKSGDGSLVRTLDFNTQALSVAFSPNNRLLAVGLADGTVRLMGIFP